MDRFGFHGARMNRKREHERKDKRALHHLCGECSFSQRSGIALENVLSEARPGEYEFIGILSDRPAFRCRMMSFGLLPGTKIRILEGGRGRPFLVEIRGGKFMLDLRSAAMVAIRQISPGTEGGKQ